MGVVVELSEYRERRLAARPRGDGRFSLPATFYFDLSSPFTYLMAERVERVLDRVTWRPTAADIFHCGTPWREPWEREPLRQRAERQAAVLRMPLTWPERFPESVPAAMRAADYASEVGRGAEFVLAASRLAFCGGYDLDDPETLAEAAAAAGIGLDECLAAAGDRRRDVRIESLARRLLAFGAQELPVVKVGQSLFSGDGAIAAAAAASRAVLPAGSGFHTAG